MINKRNIVGIVAVVFMVLLSAVPAFAADTATQTAQVTVSPTVSITAYWGATYTPNNTISLGSLPADNIQYSFNTQEKVRTYSNVPIDVTIRASGAFSDGGTNTIALNNFLYSGDTADQQFTTGNTVLFSDWAAPTQAQGFLEKTVPLKLTVPFGTAGGTYTTTVYFTATQHT